jgi:hypothetical protein
MAKFRLVKGAGPHHDGGVVYKAGQVVDSGDNLDKLFGGKFERVSGKAPEEETIPSETHTPFDTDQTTRAGAPAQEFGAESVEEFSDELDSEEGDEGGAKPRTSRRTQPKAKARR